MIFANFNDWFWSMSAEVFLKTNWITVNVLNDFLNDCSLLTNFKKKSVTDENCHGNVPNKIESKRKIWAVERIFRIKWIFRIEWIFLMKIFFRRSLSMTASISEVCVEITNASDDEIFDDFDFDLLIFDWIDVDSKLKSIVKNDSDEKSTKKKIRKKTEIQYEKVFRKKNWTNFRSKYVRSSSQKYFQRMKWS